jgi:hypothetical protein
MLGKQILRGVKSGMLAANVDPTVADASPPATETRGEQRTSE